MTLEQFKQKLSESSDAKIAALLEKSNGDVPLVAKELIVAEARQRGLLPESTPEPQVDPTSPSSSQPLNSDTHGLPTPLETQDPSSFLGEFESIRYPPVRTQETSWGQWLSSTTVTTVLVVAISGLISFLAKAFLSDK